MTDGSSNRVPETPDDTSLGPQDEVAQQLEAAQDWRGLAEHLEAQLASSPEDAPALAIRLALLVDRRMQLPRKAAAILEDALDRTPGHHDLFKELEALQTRDENWAGLVECYRRGVKAATDIFEKTALLDKMRRIQQDLLGDTKSLRVSCLHALAVDPKCRWAWKALEASHAEDESWWEMVQSLTKAAMHAGDNAGMITLRIATVMDERLEQVDKAITLYEAALDGGAEPGPALDGLEALYAETENWPKLVHTYERLVRLADGPIEAAEIKRNWAMVLSDALGDIPGAVALYDAILANNPDDQDALDAKAALAQRGG